MNRLTENKIVMVVRKTRLDELVARHNTREQARFYVERLGSDFGDYLEEHDRYKRSLAVAEAVLRHLGRVQIVDRLFLPNFVFGREDTVVVLGQDGLVANTLKYLEEQPVIGVNPDPERWDGVLLPFRVEDLSPVVRDVFGRRRRISAVTMAKVELADGQSLHAVNDLFIGARTHVSARYAVRIGACEERHSSSGIIISTGLGSTGWLRSVIAGAAGVVGAVLRRDLDVGDAGPFAWDAGYLRYSVREPFPSKTTGTLMVFGRVTRDAPMSLESHMAGHGVIFSDGIESDYLEFNSGMKAIVGVADKRGHLVV